MPEELPEVVVDDDVPDVWLVPLPDVELPLDCAGANADGENKLMDESDMIHSY